MEPAVQLALALDLPDLLTLLPSLREQLLPLYGPQRDSYRPDPMCQLVAAMISSRTRDEVSLAAFERLRLRYPSWETLARAAPKEVEAVIQPVEHAERKAVLLLRALRMMAARNGSFDLDFLAMDSEEEAMRWLRTLPGVGAKVAATTLNFSYLRKRTFSVDTHLLRVGERLGLLPRNTDYEDGYDIFMSLVPDHWDADDLYEFHWLMKLHGQRVCRHTAPDCRRCSLRAICRHPEVAHSTVSS
jgi:endonuclease-3